MISVVVMAVMGLIIKDTIGVCKDLHDRLCISVSYVN